MDHLSKSPSPHIENNLKIIKHFTNFPVSLPHIISTNAYHALHTQTQNGINFIDKTNTEKKPSKTCPDIVQKNIHVNIADLHTRIKIAYSFFVNHAWFDDFEDFVENVVELHSASNSEMTTVFKLNFTAKRIIFYEILLEIDRKVFDAFIETTKQNNIFVIISRIL